jgi:ribosomal protein L7/L12
MTPITVTTLQFSDFAILAWIVVAFGGGAAAAYTSRQSEGLRRIERKLDVLLKHQGVSLPPRAKMSEEVQQLARDPLHKIKAIQLHREQTGLGLAEAKSDVEEFIKTIQ